MKITRELCKSNQVFERAEYLCNDIRLIAEDALDYAIQIGVGKPVITETVTNKLEDLEMNRVSDTHRTCRAVDLRVIDWSGEQIDAMIEYLTEKYGHLGAENSEGKKVVVLYHDNGHGPHFHIQVARQYAQHNPLEV
jgi:hypothetical protein